MMRRFWFSSLTVSGVEPQKFNNKVSIFCFFRRKFHDRKKKTARKTFSDVRDPVASGNRIPTRWTSAVDVAFNELLFFFILIYSQQTASRWCNSPGWDRPARRSPGSSLFLQLTPATHTKKKLFSIFYFFITFLIFFNFNFNSYFFYFLKLFLFFY